MVGFYTYDLVPNGGSTSYGLGEISRGKGRYSVVSDRAAFVHRSYLTSISAKAATDARIPRQPQALPDGETCFRIGGLDPFTSGTARSGRALWSLTRFGSPFSLKALG